MPVIDTQRNSKMVLGEVYFWTDTVKDWKHLLRDKYKTIIIDTWRELVFRRLIDIYGFVIMPNHLHVIWEMLCKNGKEMPYASFNKQTSHLIIKDLKANHPKVLPYFRVDEPEREFRVWKRDPLAIRMGYQKIVDQKLKYTHYNPLHERWKLVEKPELYHWSSAKFYETGIDDFGFLTHYRERFG